MCLISLAFDWMASGRTFVIVLEKRGWVIDILGSVVSGEGSLLFDVKLLPAGVKTPFFRPRNIKRHAGAIAALLPVRVVLSTVFFYMRRIPR